MTATIPTQDEWELLSRTRRLNEAGQRRVLRDARLLSEHQPRRARLASRVQGSVTLWLKSHFTPLFLPPAVVLTDEETELLYRYRGMKHRVKAELLSRAGFFESCPWAQN